MQDELFEAIKESAIKKEETIESKEPDLQVDTQPTTPVVPDDKSVELDIKDFNEKYGKRFGREIKEQKELEEIFSAPNKTKELEDKLKEYETGHNLTKKELADLRAEYDAKKENLQYFNIRDYVGEDLLKISEMRKKYPGKDTAVMTQIASMDLDKADPVDLLIKKELLNDSDIYKGMDDSQIKEVISSSLGGVDLNDPSTWDSVTKAKIAKAAKEIRNEFKAMQEVELPVPVDIEKLKSGMISKEKERYEQSKGQWKPIVDQMLGNISSTEISFSDSDGEIIKYTPKVDDAFKEEVNKMVEFVSYQGLPVDEKTLTEIRNDITERWIGRNATKILRDLHKKVTTELTDKFHDENHNDKPLSDKNRPPEGAGDVMDKVAAMFSN